MKTELTDTQCEHQQRAIALLRSISQRAGICNEQLGKNRPPSARMMARLISEDVVKLITELEAMR